MKIPLSWLKDYIDLDGLTVEEIARKLTLAGLEVEEIKYVGLPMPEYQNGEKHEFKTSGVAWDKEKLVVAEIREVMPHPNADRLTLLDRPVVVKGAETLDIVPDAPGVREVDTRKILSAEAATYPTRRFAASVFEKLPRKITRFN